MAATNLPSKTSPKAKKISRFITQLRQDYPKYKFKSGHEDFWSPRSATITYNPDRPLIKLQYGVLHELSHALLDHVNFTSDFELLKMEAEAWHKAAEIGKNYGVDISDDHIQDCLDTYRDWLHRRSRCPKCGMHVLQASNTSYKCFNCGTKWTVTDHRFVRAYRRLYKAKHL